MKYATPLTPAKRQVPTSIKTNFFITHLKINLEPRLRRKTINRVRDCKPLKICYNQAKLGIFPIKVGIYDNTQKN
jgi:hypothetical protein